MCEIDGGPGGLNSPKPNATRLAHETQGKLQSKTKGGLTFSQKANMYKRSLNVFKITLSDIINIIASTKYYDVSIGLWHVKDI